MNINIDLIYPVGSVYITVNDVNPKVLFGGEWEQTCKSRCLAGAGTNLANTDNSYGTYTESSKNFGAGGRIGEWTHTLTTSEMPSHTHIPYVADSNGYSGSDGKGAGSGYAGDYHKSYLGTGTTATGGSGAHNNLPPMEFFYIWKRIA